MKCAVFGLEAFEFLLQHRAERNGVALGSGQCLGTIYLLVYIIF